MEADIALVILLTGGFLLGVLRGALRQLIVLGAWIVVFVVSAYLRPVVGDWIASNDAQYSREYVDMLGFLVSFLVLFTVAVLIIEIGGSTIQLSQRPAVDEILGGFLALGATLLAIAAVAIALDSYYAAGTQLGQVELDMVHGLHVALTHSAIVRAMHDSLIPGLMALLGPLLPAVIRSVYA